MGNSDYIWLAKPAPRYTSYPTAPNFHEGVNAEAYLNALENISGADPISLYVHVPFCRSLCLYCGCHTSITQRKDRIDAYLTAVKKEISILSSKIGNRLKVSHLHFGGGSPNIMSDDQIKDLFSTLNRSFDFFPRSEIAMELDPRLVSKDQIYTLAKYGVTRVSLGVQDFNSNVQQAVNREQSYSIIADICDWVRSAGIKGINFDLMYGLPLQTPATIVETMQHVVNLVPDRISFFSYAHVPQLKKHQLELEKYGLPDKHTLLDLEQAGREVLLAADYVAIGMDHFAKPNDSMTIALCERRLRRNFQGYTDDVAETILGIGASSIGFAGNKYFQNERDVEKYQEIITGGNLATVRGVGLSQDDKLRAKIISDLMCYMECAVDMLVGETKKLEPFYKAGIVEIKNSKICLKTRHRTAVRAICQLFDIYVGKAGVVQSKMG